MVSVFVLVVMVVMVDFLVCTSRQSNWDHMFWALRSTDSIPKKLEQP